MEHELLGGALGVDPRGDDPHLRDPPAPMAAPPVAVSISSFRDLDVGVQWKREPRRRPLAPRPRHHLKGPLVRATGDEPFLRREWVWFLSGSLSLLCRREPADRSYRNKMEQGPGRRRSKKGWTGRARTIPYLWPVKANRQAPRSQVIMTRFACRDLSNPCSCRDAMGKWRRHGEVETPTSNQLPRVAQGCRLLGPAALCSCPFGSLHGQVRVSLGPGGYCRRSGNGGPQTCLPMACGVAQRGAQHGPSSSTQTQDPREGASLAGRTTQSFLRHGLIRLAREEAERSRLGTS